MRRSYLGVIFLSSFLETSFHTQSGGINSITTTAVAHQRSDQHSHPSSIKSGGKATTKATTYSVTHDGTAFLIDGLGRPELTLNAETAYTFSASSSLFLHPFIITTSSSGGTSNGTISEGITGTHPLVDAGDQLVFTPTNGQIGTTLYYQCSSHVGEGARITIEGTTYYSTASGTFSTLANWNTMRDGSGTAPSTLTGNTFVVQNGYSIGLNANASAYTLTIEEGGFVDMSSFGLSLTDFNLENGGTLMIGGTTTAVPGTNRSLDSISTVEFYGDQTTLTDHFTFGNLTWKSDQFTYIYDNLTINGDFVLDNNANFRMSGDLTHTILGDLWIHPGSTLLPARGGDTVTWNINGNLETVGTIDLTDDASVCSLNVGGNISVVGEIRKSSGFTLSVTLNGTIGQSISGLDTLDNIVINNSSGVTLSGTDIIVMGVLTLTKGILTTGSNTIYVSSSGSLSRNTGGVIGNLSQAFSSAGSKLYPVGTVSGYSPVTINVTSGSGALTVTSVQGPHPNAISNNVLQRFWRISSSDPMTADLTFEYRLGDVVGNEQ